MSYKEIEAINNKIMELPAALRIGRILFILNDADNMPEAALEYVQEA